MSNYNNFDHERYDYSATIDLADAANNNDIEKLKICLINEKPANIHHKEELALLCAINNGHLEIVKFLLTYPNLKEHAYINGYKLGQEVPFTDSPLSLAALHNDFDIVKYLLTSEDLVEKASIRLRNDLAFQSACQCPNTKIIDYLCFSPELNEHVNLKNDHTFFKNIFQFGTIENLDYVLEKHIVGYPTEKTLQTCFEKIRFYETNTSKKLDYLFSLKGSENINIYHNNNEFFKRAIENKDCESLTYIIIEHSVHIYDLPNICQLLEDPKYEKIKDHIDKSLLYNTLHQTTFNNNTKENKKRKI